MVWEGITLYASLGIELLSKNIKGRILSRDVTAAVNMNIVYSSFLIPSPDDATLCSAARRMSTNQRAG